MSFHLVINSLCGELPLSPSQTHTHAHTNTHTLDETLMVLP